VHFFLFLQKHIEAEFLPVYEPRNLEYGGYRTLIVFLIESTMIAPHNDHLDRYSSSTTNQNKKN